MLWGRFVSNLNALFLKSFLSSLLLVCILLPAWGQSNPYKIHDSCYVYFQKAEQLSGTEEFRSVNDKLMKWAKATGDTKAETLYYVEELKNLTAQARRTKHTEPEFDKKVDDARRTLTAIADQYGFPQYYYYAYELSQTYYFNHEKFTTAQGLIQEMQNIALERNDDFGLWTGYRYLVSLYIHLFDYRTAKKYIYKALDLYENTTSETVKRQSTSRLYCDLSDAFPIGADSVKINIEKAVQEAKEPMDTLRCQYHLAKLYAYNKQIPQYKACRDFCLASPFLPRISPSAPKMFSVIDDIIAREVGSETVQRAISIERIREVKYIANIAEEYGFKDDAFIIEKNLVARVERFLSENNMSRFTEIDAQIGNGKLRGDLQEKSRTVERVTRILLLLVVLILVAILSFTIIQIRTLKKIRLKDSQQIRELQEANERVRLADAAKTRFVQNMSHEVRTPLNAIVGFSQLLSLPDGSFSPEEKDEFAGHIINNTKMLTMLLDDILNASAMDSGNYRIVYEDGEAHFMAQAAISSAEHRLQPGVRMYYVPESEEPVHLQTDPRRVQQILINLLTNACKHTAQGEIRLSSSLSETPGFLTYAVTDTGPGVPADQAEKIFERFTKLNDFVQGTGLGLSICRDIAGRMGAKVYLDTSYTGGGARFVFTVPLQPPTE